MRKKHFIMCGCFLSSLVLLISNSNAVGDDSVLVTVSAGPLSQMRPGHLWVNFKGYNPDYQMPRYIMKYNSTYGYGLYSGLGYVSRVMSSTPPIHNATNLTGALFASTFYPDLWLRVTPIDLMTDPPDDEKPLAPDKGEASTRDPINLISGNMDHDRTDIAVACPGPDLLFARSYNSGRIGSGPMGVGWAHSLDWGLVLTNKIFGGLHSQVLSITTGTGPQLWLTQDVQGQDRWTSYRDGYWRAVLTNGYYELGNHSDYTWRFNTNGVLEQIVDHWGNGVTLSYTSILGQTYLQRADHSNGLALDFIYTGNLLTQVNSPPPELSVTFAYLPVGVLTQAVRHVGSMDEVTGYEYATNAMMTKIINTLGDEYTYSYTTNHTGETVATNMVLLPDYYSHSVNYFTNEHYSTATYHQRGTNQTTEYHYNPDTLMITRKVGPNGTNRVEVFTYDSWLNRIDESMTDYTASNSIARAMEYDSRKRLTRRAFGYNTSPRNPWQTQWHANYHQPTRTIDPSGHTVEMDYTNAVLSHIRVYNDTSSFLSTRFGYTTNGLMNRITNANGNVTTNTYDPYGRLASVSPPLGPTTSYANNALGFVEAITTPGTSGNRVTTFDPDALGRIQSITYPDSLTETFGYDPIGDLTNHVDRASRITRMSYLPARKLSSVTRGLPSLTNTISYTYDQQFNSLLIRDPLDRPVEQYTLDIQDRPIQVINVESQSMSMVYGLNDMVLETTRFDGSVISNQYNGDGRVSQVQYPDNTIHYGYLANGLPRTGSDNASSISNTYDQANRLTGVSTLSPLAFLCEIAYSLDDVGNVTNTLISIEGTSVLTNAYRFDANERLTSITSANAQQCRLDYHAYNGLICSVSNLASGIEVSYDYDIMDRIESIRWQDGAGTALLGLGYAYNAAGMITNIIHHDGSHKAYQYDSLDRLTRETHHNAYGTVTYDAQYTYDAAGNRLGKQRGNVQVNYTLAYGTNGNRLATWSATSADNFAQARMLPVHGYSSEPIGIDDRFGELWVSNGVSVVIPEVSGTNFSVAALVLETGEQSIVAAIGDEAGNMGYTTNTVTMRIVTNGFCHYDAAGCLTSSVYRGISYPEHTISYTWDGQYRLTGVLTNGMLCESYGYDVLGRRDWTYDGSETNYHVYDGIHIMADLDASGSLLRNYTWGSGTDNLLSMTDYAGGETNTYFALTDHLGTVHALTDESGTIVESYDYDAFGRVLGVFDADGNPLAQSAVGNRWLFQGREYAWVTGLYNFRARWYDPISGRWLSKDPIGISGGLNQYVACRNNPVNFIDPDGESAIAAADYWASMAGSGYNQGGFGGWWKVQTGNTMGMFINMWHAQEMEEHAGLAGEYWDECKGKSAKHMAAVGGYAVLDYVQFTGLQKLGDLTGEGRQGTRIIQFRNKATGRPVFRLDKGPVPGKVGPKLHYHRPPDLSLHHPYQGGL